MNLQISADKRTLESPLGALETKPYQIVATVRLEVRGLLSGEFPAIVDTGFNHNFSISGLHLRMLGIDPDGIENVGYITVSRNYAPMKNVGVVLAGIGPLIVPQGIAVWETGGPRLPLLGLRAIVASGLRLVVDGKKVAASIERMTDA